MRFSVPKEAVQLDFVFSNVMSGEGLYDNRGGFDYHLPIEGGTGVCACVRVCAGSVRHSDKPAPPPPRLWVETVQRAADLTTDCTTAPGL